MINLKKLPLNQRVINICILFLGIFTSSCLVYGQEKNSIDSVLVYTQPNQVAPVVLNEGWSEVFIEKYYQWKMNIGASHFWEFAVNTTGILGEVYNNFYLSEELEYAAHEIAKYCKSDFNEPLEALNCISRYTRSFLSYYQLNVYDFGNVCNHYSVFFNKAVLFLNIEGVSSSFLPLRATNIKTRKTFNHMLNRVVFYY